MPWHGGAHAGFAPPEAWRSGCALGARSDVFGIGLIGGHLLTGFTPSSEGGPGPEDLSPLLAQLRERAPKPLYRTLARCLESDPARRFADARSLGQALTRTARKCG